VTTGVAQYFSSVPAWATLASLTPLLSALVVLNTDSSESIALIALLSLSAKNDVLHSMQNIVPPHLIKTEHTAEIILGM